MALRLSTFVFFLLAVMLAACAPPASQPQPQPPAVRLEGTSWVLDSFLVGGDEIPVVSGSQVTLIFDDGEQVGGNAGCNSYGGGYRVNGSRITFSEIFSTRMACLEGGVMEQEQHYLTALGKADTFEAGADRLMIRFNDGQDQLIFVPQP
jgi:heat shock protein HslJ